MPSSSRSLPSARTGLDRCANNRRRPARLDRLRSGAGAAACRHRAVHQPRLLFLSSGRPDDRQLVEGPEPDRPLPAGRLLGLSRLEGHTRQSRLLPAPAGLFGGTRRSGGLHAADRGRWGATRGRLQRRRGSSRHRHRRRPPERADGTGHHRRQERAAPTTSRSASRRCGARSGWCRWSARRRW